jgi:hypothetical protein
MLFLFQFRRVWDIPAFMICDPIVKINLIQTQGFEDFKHPKSFDYKTYKL